MGVHAAVDPLPPIRHGVLRVRHVRAGIEAPRRVRLGSDDVSAAEEGPDDAGAALVRRVMLLWLVRIYRGVCVKPPYLVD